MAEFFDAISDKHRAFIAKQPVFFVGTAAEGCRVNVSPKGMDVFRVLGPNHVAYLDLGGSGNETQAHLSVDGRITIMFCAFDNPALIMRLYGTGTFTVIGDPGFDELAVHFPKLPGTRQVFDIHVDSLQTSCGWAVPRMTLEKERDTLVRFHAQQDPEERLARIATRNKSIDGLPVRVQTVLLDAADWMALVELGRFDRNEAHILIGRLESEDIPAIAFDGNASIADGSQFFIPVRVMVHEDDLVAARAIVTSVAR